jgi:hypothetical protein
MGKLLQIIKETLSDYKVIVSPHPIHYRRPYGISNLDSAMSEASRVKASPVSALEPDEKSLDEISEKLTKDRPKISETQAGHVEDYTTDETGSSYHINTSLIDAHNNGTHPEGDMIYEDKRIHRTISKLTENPIGHSVDLYSGVGFDPEKLLGGSSNSILHLPAHTSTTHSPLVALKHAMDNRPRTGKGNGNAGNTAHIIKISTTPKTKGFHVGDLSEFNNERETILPAKTNLIHSHTTMHTDENNPNIKVKIHHFAVHSQEND